jgi:hypothetical protein
MILKFETLIFSLPTRRPNPVVVLNVKKSSEGHLPKHDTIGLAGKQQISFCLCLCAMVLS